MEEFHYLVSIEAYNLSITYNAFPLSIWWKRATGVILIKEHYIYVWSFKRANKINKYEAFGVVFSTRLDSILKFSFEIIYWCYLEM